MTEKVIAHDSCSDGSCHSHDHKHDHEHNHEHEHDHGGCDSCGSSCGSSCGCAHEEKASRLDICLFALSIILFAVALTPIHQYLKLSFFVLSALAAGYEMFWSGLKELVKFRLQENALLLIAVVASFILGEYPEACLVTILFRLGSFLEGYAVSRSRKSMEELTKIRPEFAVIKNEKGEFETVEAKSLAIGDIIYLRAGDKVPLDCEVITGNSDVDTSALTGESISQYVEKGDNILSGSVNLSGLLCCKVTADYENSAASKIIEMVYSSNQKKGKAESFITRFAKLYTPIVVVLAVAIAVIPPLFKLGEFNDYIMRALIFLVASCPCSLVISIPLSFFSAIGAISKRGVLVKGSMYVESLANVNAACFDKTGTITAGKLTVDEITILNGADRNEVIGALWGIEEFSSHPIAQSITEFAKAVDGVKKLEFTSVNEIAGLGVEADCGDSHYLCGGERLLINNKISTSLLPKAGVYIAKDGIVVGYVTTKEEILEDSLTIASKLNDVGVDTVVMLTGDSEANAMAVASKCGIKEYHASLLPQDKTKWIQTIKKRGKKTLFVGDGINDAPVIAEADLGISMGIGSDAANASSDIILVSNRLRSIPAAISIAKRSMKIINFNIIFSLAVKLVVLILGATGYGSMWLAVFADIGVTIIAVLNSTRILAFSDKN